MPRAGAPASSADPSDPGLFTWPPRRPPAPAPPPPSPHQPARAASSPAPSLPPPRPTSWSAFESVFLDRLAGPLPQRAAEVGWSPDHPSAYCPRCGQSLPPPAATPARPAAACPRCEALNLAWDRFIRLGPYETDLRRWIHELKFTRWRRLGLDLGSLLGQAVLHIARQHGRDRDPWLIIPVPDHPLRRLWRGIDHTGVIAEGVHRATGWPVARPLRRRLGRSQLAVRPSQRVANVAGAFSLARGPWNLRLPGHTLLVVDDVATTGATMRACCRILRAAAGPAAPIWAATLARTPQTGSNARPSPRKMGRS